MLYVGAFVEVTLVNPHNDHIKSNYLDCGCHFTNFTDDENVAQRN